MSNIVVYSKKEGTNKLLPISTNDNLVNLARFVEKHYPEEKEFVYALINGIEIKLF